MKYIKLKDTYAVDNCKTVAEYLREDNSIVIAVEDNYYAPLARDIKAFLKTEIQPDQSYIETIIYDIIPQYNANVIYIDKEIDY